MTTPLDRGLPVRILGEAKSAGGQDARGPRSISQLILPASLHAQLIDEARRAFPRECCGLIEGVRGEKTIEALQLHPARNLSVEPDRFEIDPVTHIALARALRGTAREIVGCYHSHPNGIAAPSPRDRENIGEEGFVWLIVAADLGGDAEIGAFVALRDDLGPHFRNARLSSGPKSALCAFFET
jgi:desampylase